MQEAAAARVHARYNSERLCRAMTTPDRLVLTISSARLGRSKLMRPWAARAWPVDNCLRARAKLAGAERRRQLRKLLHMLHGAQKAHPQLCASKLDHPTQRAAAAHAPCRPAASRRAPPRRQLQQSCCLQRHCCCAPPAHPPTRPPSAAPRSTPPALFRASAPTRPTATPWRSICESAAWRRKPRCRAAPQTVSMPRMHGASSQHAAATQPRVCARASACTIAPPCRRRAAATAARCRMRTQACASQPSGARCKARCRPLASRG